MSQRLLSRLLTVNGCLLVLAAFFLPVVRGCRSDVVPYEAIARKFERALDHPGWAEARNFSVRSGPTVAVCLDSHLREKFHCLVLYGLPFLSALLPLVGMLLTGLGRLRSAHALLYWYLVFVFLCIEVALVPGVIESIESTGFGAVRGYELRAALSPLPIVGLFIGFANATRDPRMGGIGCRFLLALAMTGFFSWIGVEFGIGVFRYGMWVAIAGSALIMAGSVLEWHTYRARR
ncbi:MAG: hypothetical protein Q7T59_02860 [Candidatus Woesebacteria bacterium]|nr:hypothetical protein [Candidatus Woesebacteria bacterium]